LQAHGEDLGFRNIYVREISSGEDQFDAKLKRKEGFKSCLNGRDLIIGVGNKTDYIMETNELLVAHQKEVDMEILFTAEEYSRISISGLILNTLVPITGFGLHAPLNGDAAYDR